MGISTLASLWLGSQALAIGSEYESSYWVMCSGKSTRGRHSHQGNPGQSRGTTEGGGGNTQNTVCVPKYPGLGLASIRLYSSKEACSYTCTYTP